MDGSAQKSSRRWRVSRAEMLPVLIPGDEWHPLDGGIAPEYVPEFWDGPHVGLRLVQAFKTLAHLPGGIGSSTASAFWPEYWYEWEDYLAQKTADTAAQEDDARARNRGHVRPSAQEISRMETAICWPGRYISEVDIARIVQRVALARSRDLDMQHVSRKLRLDPKRLRDKNRRGLDLIAAGLRHNVVRVF